MPMRVQRRGGSEWLMAGVTECRQMIEQGSTYQVNLTDRFDGVLADAPFELYRAMATAQGGGFNAYFDLGDLVVVSASPELFLHVDKDHVMARPMKGTARRRPRPADDQRVGEDLVESEKDRAENVMIVELMRNDLSRLAPYGGVKCSVSLRRGTVRDRLATHVQRGGSHSAKAQPRRCSPRHVSVRISHRCAKGRGDAVHR